jgi:hypothetical protein
MEKIDSATECLGHWARYSIGEIFQGCGLDANNIFASAVHGNRMVAEEQWLVASG